MRSSKAEIIDRVHKIPEIRFEDQRLTSYAGVVVLQALFSRLQLKNRLKGAFRHREENPVYGHHLIVLILIVHFFLGFRRLRDIDYYRDDPMVLRLLGLKRLPDVATVSRRLATADAEAISNVRHECREMIIARLQVLALCRVTLDFDGSVNGSDKVAEGTAVGFNKRKKGQRSYYPLFCTVAQSGQVFDVLMRPGNVHDSNGAREFILTCISLIRAACPGIIVEVRMDSAFFSDAIVSELDRQRVEFTISVPFERFAELKGIIEGRRRWRVFNEVWSHFETNWKPKKWDNRYRFIFVRQKVNKQQKGPVQLDLFIPHQHEYQFSVIVTNKPTTMKKVMAFHHGRGSQEQTLGELKSQAQMDYIAVRRLHGNTLYLMSAVLTHNLNRELQMITRPQERKTTEKRAALWIFRQLNTFRQTILHRAGRLTTPQGTLTLTMSGNKAAEDALLGYFVPLRDAA